MKKFPRNGFVTRSGRLTKKGRAAVTRFMADYPCPLGFVFAKNRRLHAAMRRQIAGGMYEQDDALAMVYRRVSSGVRWFDPRNGAALNTYLCHCVLSGVGEIVRHHATRKATMPTVSMDAVWGHRDYRIVDFVTAKPDADPEPWGVFSDHLRKLPAAHREVIDRRFRLDQTNAEIGLAMGVTRERVRQIVVDTGAKLASLAGFTVASGVKVRKKVRSRWKPHRRDVKCFHCGVRNINRPRGLCYSCFGIPGVKELYPPTAKCGRKVLGVK